jgi:hypothetical protein
VGETHWGCLAEKARLKGDWLVKLPAAFSARQAMAIGTAGYTAMLCVLALRQAAVDLLDGGATVPFIARYRKEATGGLDDIQLRELERAWATCASWKTAAPPCSRASTSRAS